MISSRIYQSSLKYSSTMKKQYIAPVSVVRSMETQQIIALSLQTSKADDSDALTKDAGDWDIWSDDEVE